MRTQLTTADGSAVRVPGAPGNRAGCPAYDLPSEDVDGDCRVLPSPVNRAGSTLVHPVAMPLDAPTGLPVTSDAPARGLDGAGRSTRRSEARRARSDARAMRDRRNQAQGGEAGMATAEYAIATLAAVGFAALLVAVLSSNEIRGLLMSLITSALSFG